MKKFLFLLSALFSFNAFAANLEEGKQYVQVGQTASAQPEVIEFFSFYCPHCYAFEMEYHIPKQVAESLPKGTEFKQYHVNFLGRQSEPHSCMGISDGTWCRKQSESAFI